MGDDNDTCQLGLPMVRTKFDEGGAGCGYSVGFRVRVRWAVRGENRHDSGAGAEA